MENQIKRRFFEVLIPIFIAFFCAFDVWDDIRQGESSLHIQLEIFITIGCFVYGSWLFREYFKVKNRLNQTVHALRQQELTSTQLQAQNDNLNAELLNYVKGLGQIIDEQFKEWKLSPAESEVALLLLKGFSVKEIADLRSVAERTVRQQTATVYEKSALSGRSELAAFFLEDFLSIHPAAHEDKMTAR